MDEILNDYRTVLFSCFSFDRKLRRKPFWTYIIITFFIQMLSFLITFAGVAIIGSKYGENLNQAPPIIGFLFGAIVLFFILFEFALGISTIGPQVCRLRDGGFSPWLMLLHFCQLSIVVFVLLCLESKD